MRLKNAKFVVFSVAGTLLLTIGLCSPALSGNFELKSDLVDGVSLKALSLFTKEFQGKARLHVKVNIQNTGAKPKRFNVTIQLPEAEQTASAFVPRKGKPAVIEPGDVNSVTLPLFYHQMPEKLVLIVE